MPRGDVYKRQVDGSVKNRYSDSRIEIDGSTEVLILIANVTSFNGFGDYCNEIGADYYTDDAASASEVAYAIVGGTLC